MAAVTLWGWDETNKVYRKILVDDSGNLSISPITFPTEYPLPAAQVADLKAITSYPDPIISQATPGNLKHVPHGYYAVGGTYLPYAVDVDGKLVISGGGGGTLASLTDVDLTGLTNGDFIYYDSASSTWKRIAHKDATTGVHGVGTDSIASTKKYGARVYLSANQTIPSGAWSLIAFDTKDFDKQTEFTITSKTGLATATTANHLVDTTKNQFVAGDVGKWVWNTTDNTYTTITTYNSVSDVTLAANIMVNGEGYNVYDSYYTVSVTGDYFISATILLDSPTDQALIGTGICKNGSTVAYSVSDSYTTASGVASVGCSQANVVSLLVNDILRVTVYQGCGSAKALVGLKRTTNFTVYKM